MRIKINTEFVKDVFIISPKYINGTNEIEYYHFSLFENHEFAGGEIITDLNIENDWYKYSYKEGNEYGDLLCKDDSLVILYGIKPYEDVQFVLQLMYQTNEKHSSDFLPTHRYYYYYQDGFGCYGRNFIDLIRYVNQDNPGNEYKTNAKNNKDKEISLYEYSASYYEKIGIGYTYDELDDLLHKLFKENMLEDDYKKYEDGEKYNQAYFPEEFIVTDNKENEQDN